MARIDYSNMSDIIEALRNGKQLEKRSINETTWKFTDDVYPDFQNFVYRVYIAKSVPCVVGLFYNGENYIPKTIYANSKEELDDQIKETVRNDPTFRKWISDIISYII